MKIITLVTAIIMTTTAITLVNDYDNDGNNIKRRTMTITSLVAAMIMRTTTLTKRRAVTIITLVKAIIMRTTTKTSR